MAVCLNLPYQTAPCSSQGVRNSLLYLVGASGPRVTLVDQLAVGTETGKTLQYTSGDTSPRFDFLERIYFSILSLATSVAKPTFGGGEKKVWNSAK